MNNKTFRNPLSTGHAADPYVKYIDGYYYAMITESRALILRRSKSLDTVLQGEEKVLFTATPDGPIQDWIWAPELHYIPSTGKWYVYACGTMKNNDFITMRMFCIESVTSDPFGEYVFKDYTDKNTLAIDQTVFYDEKSGSLYAAFSHFTPLGQVIQLAVMDNPWTISDRRLMVSFPKYDWEKLGKTEGKDERVNEGPIFLFHGEKLFLIYSASGCWSRYYCLGLLEYVGEDFTPDNMMNEANWKKSETPIFSEGNDVYGVGHCSFFDSADGKETWIAYHGMHTPDAGEPGRFMYAQKIDFDENGIPVLGKPLSRDTDIPLPSGANE